MSKHHPGSESETKHKGDHKREPVEDKSTTAQHLLDDAQGRWLNKNQPDAVSKLVQDGVLPVGSSVIDFDKVSSQLTKDKQELEKLSKTAPADIVAATKDLMDLKATLVPAQLALDGAQKSVDAIQARIDGRTNQDQQVQKDFDTLTKDTKDSYFYGSTLKALSEDDSKSQEVRDAAKRLLDTFHKQGRGSSNSEFGTRGWGEAYINQGSISQKTDKDDLLNKGDGADLTAKSADRDKAKGVVDGINSDVSSKDAALSKNENWCRRR